MKNLYLTAILLGTTYLSANSQSSIPMETVGTPGGATPVASYTGWTNNGVLTYTGDAQVRNTNVSNNLSASGGGNVYFTNVIGTNLTIAGFAPSTAPQSLDISFDMFGYDAANLGELVLEYSTDGGTTYNPMVYRRMFRNYMAPTPWDVMVSDPLPAGSINFTTLKVRFRQTTSTKTFYIDDIQMNLYYSLPIKLLSFSAQQLKGENYVQWKASSTDEHEYFVVEKSIDGRHFTALGNVEVKGIGDYTYSFADHSTGKTFYRLKLVDVSGKSSYSQIVFVDSKASTSDLIQKIYPIPAKQVLNTQLYSSKQDEATVTLTDMSGRTVTTKSYSLNQGINNCAINVERLKPGMYILKIITGNVSETKPVMVQ